MSGNVTVNIYARNDDPKWITVMNAIEKVVPVDQVQIQQTLEKLIEVCDSTNPQHSIFVISLGSHLELERLLEANIHLEDRRVLLILPDSGPSTISKGHGVRPRILLSPPLVTEELSDFIEKMLFVSRKELSRNTQTKIATFDNEQTG